MLPWSDRREREESPADLHGHAPAPHLMHHKLVVAEYNPEDTQSDRSAVKPLAPKLWGVGRSDSDGAISNQRGQCHERRQVKVVAQREIYCREDQEYGRSMGY